MAKYYQPPKSVIELVESILRRYHEHLEDARIGVLFRDEAPQSGSGLATLGMAKKVSPDAQAAGLQYDFIIWFAEDVWLQLTTEQRTALVDHELMHCEWVLRDGEFKARIRPHDFEEFNEIIARHGLWWPGAQETRQAIQAHTMPLFGRTGKVEAADGALVELAVGLEG